MNVMKCENLSKSYGSKSVLTDLDLTLERGKIYGLIGRNGAGKTTLLSILSNQNPATNGSATLDGEPIWENRNALDKICFSRELNITQENGLSGYTVKKYLATAACYFSHWDSDMATHLAERFGLNPKDKLGKLSKGMLSMVTIIVALASKAEFTFLDEPVAGLDVLAREDFYRILLDEYTETGRTFVISTHIIEEAADVIEDVIILDHGKILRKENAQSLIDRARHVSGLSEQVDAVTAGMECHRAQRMGRSKSVTVLLKDGETLPQNSDVTVQPINLQKIFVALCGEEESV